MVSPGDYAAWLVRIGGRRAQRALIRARQRYEALKPTRARLRRVHVAYRRRR